MKKSLIVLLLLAACRNTVQPDQQATDSTIVIPADTVPAIRQKVSERPVAEYSEPISDSLNNWKFSVSVYETKRTFHYNLRIQAKEVRISDSINLPNFGTMPKPVLRKGKDPQSCIIGFLDRKNLFKEYRLISFTNNQLHIKTLKSYYVASYKTPVN